MTGQENPKADKNALPKEFYASDKGRPVIKFKDVGGKFLDVDDRKRRIHEGQRRRELRTNKR